jgi:hypothetical protein
MLFNAKAQRRKGAKERPFVLRVFASLRLCVYSAWFSTLAVLRILSLRRRFEVRIIRQSVHHPVGDLVLGHAGPPFLNAKAQSRQDTKEKQMLLSLRLCVFASLR